MSAASTSPEGLSCTRRDCRRGCREKAEQHHAQGDPKGSPPASGLLRSRLPGEGFRVKLEAKQSDHGCWKILAGVPLVFVLGHE